MAVPFNLAARLNLRELDLREVRKLADTSALTGRPLYAVAGAGDVAVEKLRAVPGLLASLRPTLGARAGGVYGDLAVRGQDVVRRVRGREAAAEDGPSELG